MAYSARSSPRMVWVTLTARSVERLFPLSLPTDRLRVVIQVHCKVSFSFDLLAKGGYADLTSLSLQKLPKHEEISKQRHLRKHWIPIAGSRWVRFETSFVDFARTRLIRSMLDHRSSVPPLIALQSYSRQVRALPLLSRAHTLTVGEGSFRTAALAAYEAQFTTGRR